MQRIQGMLRNFERVFLGVFSALAGGPLLGLELFPNSNLWLGGWFYWGAFCWGLARGIDALAGRRSSGGALAILLLECSCGLFLVLLGFLVARVDQHPGWLLLSGLGIVVVLATAATGADELNRGPTSA